MAGAQHLRYKVARRIAYGAVTEPVSDEALQNFWYGLRPGVQDEYLRITDDVIHIVKTEGSGR